MDDESTQDTALAVDLDGTLLRTDLFAESVVALLRHNPFYLFAMAWWLLWGRAVLKRRIAERVSIDADDLPYLDPVLLYVREQFAQAWC